MKKFLSLLITAALFFGMITPAAVFAASCALENISDVQQGGKVEIKGSSSGENYYVTLYLKDESGTVRYVDLIKTENGEFSKTIEIPFIWPAGRYTAVAGFGTTTAVKNFNVTSIGEYIGIDDMYFETNQYSKIELPGEVTIKYETSDAVLANPIYVWEKELNIYSAGEYKAVGKITDMYGIERTFGVTVKVRPVSIKEIVTKAQTFEFETGEKISLPEFVKAQLSDMSSKFVPVVWTPNPEDVNTNEEKTVEFSGRIPEFNEIVTMTAKVIAKSEDIPRAGLSLWTDADKDSLSVNAEGKVSEWADKSGKGNNLVPVSVNNAPSVRENAKNKHMSLVFEQAGLKTQKADEYQGDSTIFIVYKSNSDKDGSIISSSNSGVLAGDIDIQQAENKIFAVSNNGVGKKDSAVLNDVLDTNDFHIVGIRITQSKKDGEWKKSVVDTYYDRTETKAAYTAETIGCEFNTHSGYSIGTRNAASGKYSDIEVMEVVAYQKSMSDSQIDRVRKYLNDKYLISNRYAVSSIAIANGNNLILRAIVTNNTNKDLKNSILVQPLERDGVMLDCAVTQISELNALRGTSVRENINWAGMGAEPDSKSILFDSLENLAPLAVSEYTDFISEQKSSKKAAVSNIEVLNNEVTVSGTIPSGAGKVAAVIISGDMNELNSKNIYNAGTAVTDDSGKFVYSFKLPENNKSGVTFNQELYVFAGGEASAKSEIKGFGYAGAELRENAFELLKNAEQNLVASMLDKDSEYRNALNSMGISINIYDSLDKAGKEEYVKKLSETAHNIAESGAEGIKKLSETMKSAYPLMELNAAANEKDILNILKEYQKELGFESESSEKDAFLALYLFNNKPFSNMSGYEEQKKLSGVFYSINNASFVSLTELLTGNRDLIKDAAEYEYYISLSEANRQEVNKYIVTDISNSRVYTGENLRKILDGAADKYKNKETGGNNSSRPGSGGGGSGSPSIGRIEIENTNQNNQENNKPKNIFSDLEAVPWAEAAILNLKNKNIVSGKTETEFYPSDTVTREEFVKMLAVMYGADINNIGKCRFTDCDEKMWYYPYVTAASNEGIVYGITETEFGIGQKITRAQMAVMCERVISALGISIDDAKEAEQFADYEAIPEYAIKSVILMQKAGVIRGKDGGVFDPLGYATRAEAAVIINSVLNLF